MDIIDFNINDLPNSSMNLVISKRRAGKSYLVEHIIEDMKRKNLIDVCILFTGTNAGFERVCNDPECRFNSLDKLVDIVENYKKMNDYNKQAPKSKQFKIKTTIIIDDLAQDLKSKKFSILNNLAINGRHYAYSPLRLDFFILGQSTTLFSRSMRLNADTISFTQIPSFKEFEMLRDECLCMTCHDREGRKMALEYYNNIVSEPYAFCCVEMFRNNINCLSDYIKRLKAP